MNPTANATLPSVRHAPIVTSTRCVVRQATADEVRALKQHAGGRSSGSSNGAGFVLELAPGLYRAVWAGDPGRTACVETARRYTSIRGVLRALAQARRWRSFPDACAVEVPMRPTAPRG